MLTQRQKKNDMEKVNLDSKTCDLGSLTVNHFQLMHLSGDEYKLLH